MNSREIMRLVCFIGVVFYLLAGLLAWYSGEKSYEYQIIMMLFMILGNQYEDS